MSDVPVEVSIVVVTYNTRDLTLACLESVEAETAVSHEIVLVDNASDDGTAAAVRDRFPTVTVLEPGENIGFARACNLGARSATGRFLLFLNPDTVVRDAALDRLVQFASSRPGHGLYGGRTLRADGTLEPRSVWGAPTIWSLVCFATGLSALFAGSAVFDPDTLGPWPRDTVREVPVVIGCLLLVERQAWEVLHGFDERFFMYSEDVDLSLRAADAGYRPIMTPDAAVIHLVGASAESAHRKTMVLRGQATLLRVRWTGARRALGLGLLVAGVALRAAGQRTVSALSGGRRGTHRVWSEVWASRRSWFPGYPPVSGRRAK